MRNLVQPPTSMHCELCDGELRFKRIEPDDPAFDMEVEILRLLKMRPCAFAPGDAQPLCRTHREQYAAREGGPAGRVRQKIDSLMRGRIQRTHCGLDATGSSAVVAASGFEATVVGAPAVYAIDARDGAR
jgi:hypothetical protein